MKTISVKTGTAIGFDSADITYLGAIRLLLKPDCFSGEDRVELGGLYGVALPEVSIDSLFEAINDKDEITQLALYSEIKGVEPISEIDEKLLEFFEGE